MLNWKIRKENIVFLAQILLAIITPILAYAGITASDITSWGMLINLLLDAVRNPYVLVLVLVNVWSAVNDPTSPGLSDSEFVMGKKSLNDTPKNVSAND